MNNQIVIDTIVACNSLLSTFLSGMSESEKIQLTLFAYESEDNHLIEELKEHNAIPKKLQKLIDVVNSDPRYTYVYKFDLTDKRQCEHVAHLANKQEHKEIVRALITYNIAK